MFEEYRKAYDEMEANNDIILARQTLADMQETLEGLEAPYRRLMKEAENKIVAAVLEQGKSVTLYDVYAKYTKGRKSTSWKAIADAMQAPPTLIDKHTKIGKPSVRVSIVE